MKSIIYKTALLWASGGIGIRASLRKRSQLHPPFEYSKNYLIPTLFLEKTINTSINKGAEDQATYATCLGNHAPLKMSYIRCSKNDITTTTS